MAPSSGDLFYKPSANAFAFNKPSASFARSMQTTNAHGSYNRQSAYMRWLRGYEISQSVGLDSPWYFPFFYEVEVPGATDEEEKPQIPGVFVGFPTPNTELGMHWCGARLAGAMRTDDFRANGIDGLRVEYSEVTDELITVKFEGDWSKDNPLPAPLFIDLPDNPQYPLVGEIFEDRIIGKGEELITKDTVNPENGLRYGYVSAVLAEVKPYDGIVRFRRVGSIWTSPDRVFVSPSTVGFTPGRWLSVGARYVCTCQDYLGRDYAWVSKLQAEAAMGRARGRYFPYTNARTVKLGQKERVTLAGTDKVDLSAQTSLTDNTEMRLVEGTRDDPGIFEDFGATYTNNGTGPPLFNDYRVDEEGNVIYEGSSWTQPLDQVRFCKHIYALKFASGDLTPEPSDYPIGVSVTDIEQAIRREGLKTQDSLMQRAEYGISFMNIPPYNAQTPQMKPAITKLFNLPSQFIKPKDFVMQDPITGESFKPQDIPRR